MWNKEDRKYSCDRCGTGDLRWLYFVECERVSTLFRKARGESSGCLAVDLCKECSDSLDKAIQKWVDESKQEGHVDVNIYTKTPTSTGPVNGPHLTRDVVKAIVVFIEENFSQKLTDVHSTIKYAFKPKEEK